MFAGHMAKSHKFFHDHHAHRFSDDVIALVDAFTPRFEAWFHAAGRSAALTHNDYRLDNLMFKQGAALECVAVDWQTFTVSHPGFDVGLMLGASVPTELRHAALYTIQDGKMIRVREYATRTEALKAAGLADG